MAKGRKPKARDESVEANEPAETQDERLERERREALERHKQEQIDQRRKDSDGKPIV
jgi:hypothetical protein